MVVRQETRPGAGAGETPPEFRAAVESMRAATLRPEVFCEEMPAPQRIAPHAFALSADVTVDGTDVGTGRIILLHDPDGNDAWDGTFRCVAYARAEIETDMITDPLLAGVGWTWLVEALEAHGADAHRGVRHGHPGGHRRASAGWPTRAAPPRSRSAPRGRRPAPRRRSATTSRPGASCSAPRPGLPPVPDGVTAMPSRRGQRGPGR